MLPANASAPGAKAPVRGDLLAEYAAHLARTGRGTVTRRRRLGASCAAGPIPNAGPLSLSPTVWPRVPRPSSFLIFLMVHGYLRPGYDYLVARKLTSFWREIAISPLEADMARFREGPRPSASPRSSALRVASQSVGRLLIQSGRSSRRPDPG